jgi:hypothetical protein
MLRGTPYDRPTSWKLDEAHLTNADTDRQWDERQRAHRGRGGAAPGTVILSDTRRPSSPCAS